VSKNIASPSAGRWSRRFVIVAAWSCAAFGIASEAPAATARVQWRAGPGEGAAQYRVYIRGAGTPYTGSPQWSGAGTPAADGSTSATVTYTAASSGTNYFSVAAINDAGDESALSMELPVGTPVPCRKDSCTSTSSCDFGAAADGTACDDASFCNGAETCRGGTCAVRVPRDCGDDVQCTVDACDETANRCTHVAPAGCCLACDAGDPCLAAACAEGDCTAGPGTNIDRALVQFRERASDVKATVKGRFSGDPSVDPSVTGAVVELRAADGAILYSGAIAGSAFTRSKTGQRYRFAARGAEPDPLWNGIVSLDLRAKKSSIWLVTAKAATPELASAFIEPTLTWAIRLGDTCARHMDASCTQSARASNCR
jgi:hypothetical protein